MVNQGIPKAPAGLNTQQEINYGKIIQIILSRWYWILSTVVIALLIAYINLWYTPSTFATGASLKFEEKRSEISELLNVRNVYDRTNKMQSEQFVIRSKDVLSNAVRELDYHISFYLKGRVRTFETYPEKPLDITVIEQDSLNINRTPFQYEAKTANSFILTFSENGKKISRIFQTGEMIAAGNLKFKILNSLYGKANDGVYIFNFNAPEDFIGRVNSGLTMSENKSTNILTLTQVDQNPYFAADILNAILSEYVKYDRIQRTVSATQTINFIDTLQRNMSLVVKTSGNNFEKFKINAKMLDISGPSTQITKQLEELEKEKSDLQLQRLMIDQLERDIVNNSNVNAINYNLQGITDPLLGTLVSQYNALLLKKQEALITYKPTSSAVQEIEKQMLTIKSAFVSNVKGQRAKNISAIGYVNKQTDAIRQSFNTIPKAEKDFINLQSDFEVNQKVYAYLSEKKLEAQITKAAVTPGAVIVDKASYNVNPISPIPKSAYTTAFMFGLLSGIGLIFLVRLLNPFIFDKETIESLTNIPIIGIIRKYPSKVAENNREILSIKNPKSLFAESVRSVRTNISFLAPDIKSKVICITSEISGEGKSFTSVNLASTLSLIEKKVIIIAADLRKSKLHHTFNISNLQGLSNYLSGHVSLEKVTFDTEVENLHFIPAGPVPPNPSELLYSQGMKDLLGELREKYDYIIIDSAPVGLVSDGIPLIRLSDINIFVIRSGISRYYAASVPERLSKEFSLSNISIVLNAFDNDILHSRYYSTNYTTSNYANYYYYSDQSGYTYNNDYFSGEQQRKWWQFWKK